MLENHTDLFFLLVERAVIIYEKAFSEITYTTRILHPLLKALPIVLQPEVNATSKGICMALFSYKKRQNSSIFDSLK